ncbi:MAG: hypothetical protein EOO56_23295 [Hymenobacter sp.]|nr:MAG: hypothetical protein EOO56_23295 [Hymenobacter sp.]
MKSVVRMLLIASTLMLIQGAQAQSRPAPRRVVAPKARPKSGAAIMKDGVTMKDGKLIATEMGMTNPITADKTLRNGTVITTAGMVTGRDGVATQLREGDYVSLTGRVETRTEIAAQDSLQKLQAYDLKHPGKRKEMEKARDKAAKAKEKVDKEKEKAKARMAKN